VASLKFIAADERRRLNGGGRQQRCAILPAKATGRGNSGVSLGAIVARPRPASGCGAPQQWRLCQRLPGEKPVRSGVIKLSEPDIQTA